MMSPLTVDDHTTRIYTEASLHSYVSDAGSAVFGLPAIVN